MHRTALAALLLVPGLLHAQWFNQPTPGIPRTPDGKPNLTAPAPRAPDGKPDLSGLWKPEYNVYNLDVIQSLKDEATFRPAAEAIFQQHQAEFHRSDPVTHCLPSGPLEILAAGGIAFYRIIQTPNLIALLYERGNLYRQIFMDGRALPKDPNPSWLGYSVGHWDGDTLVVESAGFNDRTWLDRMGHPHSEDLRVTERFHRSDFGHMQLQVTYDDPKTLTRPITFSVALNYGPDTDMIETICDNERDVTHMVGSAKDAVNIAPEVLAKYAGTYQAREGTPVVLGFFGRAQTFTFTGGKLYMNAIPLVPQSETKFDSAAAPVEFFTDARGNVTHVTLTANEGQVIYERRP